METELIKLSDNEQPPFVGDSYYVTYYDRIKEIMVTLLFPIPMYGDVGIFDYPGWEWNDNEGVRIVGLRLAK